MDAVVVATVVAIGVANSWVKPSNGLLTGAPVGVVAAVSGLVGLLLWWRRRAPRAVAAAVLVGHAIAFTPTATAVALFTIGAQCARQPRTLIVAAVAACAADAVALLAGRDVDPREAGYTLVLAIGPLGVGYAVALRRDLEASARAQMAGMARERDLLVGRARGQERARIAREMHDVVAHRVANVVLLAGSLALPHAGRPDETVEKAERIRSEGRHALAELREVLEVLAPGRERTAARAPLPDATRLKDLAEGAAAVGQQVDLQIQGHPEALPDHVQRAIYRVVQEGLTNAAKHAPGAAVRVEVECGVDGVRIIVDNEAPKRAPEYLPSGRNGLIGLGERLALLDGRVEAGRHNGGFRVTAWIPQQPGTPV
ncbi:histidine kinase [Streptomyces formicae]|uniref:histidine kinase n=1 Tax=Streptomyces formicae TaxID=1616117 RepID=A0ABY3WXQ4_9ACTN|nr:histidine kinase [Streptomyces formicae]UNM14558.1 hypothetical protein J4032_26590 [Streptomyces formicae]